MDKKRLKYLILYHVNSAKYLLMILALIMGINLTLGLVFKNVESPIGSIEIAAFGFALFVGYELFNDVFSFAIINGISRKTYYLSNIISTMILSVILGVVTAATVWFSITFANNLIIYTLLYGKNILGLFVWCVAVMFALITLLHFVALLVYRLSKKTKYIVLTVIVLLGPAIYLLNYAFAGVNEALAKFGLLFIGISGSGAVTPNPYLSALMMVGLSFVIIVINWLFLRKIEAK